MTAAISLLAYLVGAAIIFGFGYLWYRTTPAKHSGWALFACIFIALFMKQPTNHAVGVIIDAILTAGFAGGWYLARDKKHRGWLLFAGVLTAFSTMDYLLLK